MKTPSPCLQVRHPAPMRSGRPKQKPHHTMKTISKETRWISTDGWRGYYQPIDAVAGANNTGMYSDSPCPTNVCRAELKAAANVLKKAGIPHRLQACESSNVFCEHVYLVVPAEDVARGKELIQPLLKETRLLYTV